MTTHEYLEEDIRQAFKNVPHDVDGLFEPFKLGFLAGRTSCPCRTVSECVCHETSTRNCPIHQNMEEKQVSGDDEIYPDCVNTAVSIFTTKLSAFGDMSAVEMLAASTDRESTLNYIRGTISRVGYTRMVPMFEVERLKTELESCKSQMSCFRKAIVYGRHTLSNPKTEREIQCANILEDARAEGDRIMKQYRNPQESAE